MAGSYILPQTRVFQEFSQAPNDVTQNLNPFVIGPSFQLMRYGREDERADCSHEDYVGDQVTVPWAAGALGTVVDKSWYSVTFANAYVKLGEADSTCLDAVNDKGTRFEFELEPGKGLTGNDPAKLAFGIAVKAGDYLAYVDGDETKYTKIRSVSIGTPHDKELSVVLKKRGVSGVNPDFTVDSAGYKGEKSGSITLTVNDDKSKVTIVSTIVGIATGEKAITVGQSLNLNLGLSITPTASIAAKGVYVITVTIKEPYIRDTVTVADIIPVAASYAFVRHFDSIAARADDLLPADDGIAVAADAMVDIGPADPYPVHTATAYLNQRNLRRDHVDRVYSVRSDSDVVEALGSYDTPDNPLAYAAHIMLLNNANTAIKFIGLESDDAEGYAKALDRASLTTEVYAVCPLTEDRAIVDAVVADCNRRSSPDEKSWRISFCSIPTEKSVDVTPEDGATCTIDTNGVLAYVGGQFSETVRAGDTVSVFAGDWSDYKVVEVASNETLKLDGTFTSALSNAKFRITHVRPHGEYVEAIAETSASFRDRRAHNVFPNSLRAADGNVVSGVYAAAAVTALTCSVAPQQPITNVEVKGFSDLPEVYSGFSRDDLNEIAAGGTLILMQDKPNGTVYVRHQISTAYRDGNLNTTELSLTKNLDSISYYFAARFAPYIGQYNITDDLINELRGILEDGLAHLETTTEVSRLVGPQVIAEGTEIRALYRTAEKDKVYADVALNLPAPFNNFDLHLQVI